MNSSSGFNVNIRSGPGTQYPAVNTLAQGTAITLNGRYQNGWAQLADGTWVAAHLIRVGSAITPPRPNPQPQPETFLQVGSRNPLVIDVEGRLRDLGYVTANFPADDYYGNDTAQAVQNFQRRNRLPVDGIAGPATRDRLFSATAIDNFPDSGSPNNPDPGDPPDQGNGRQVRVRTTDGQEAIVFAGPGTEYDLLGFITDGTIVTITGRTDGNWSELDNGNWIYTDFLDL
ncbi:MAG TPA: peptidoglycan-binding protein [Candidatus Obscuribacterales bacterium]